MSQLSAHRSNTTAVLEVLFPNGTWRELVRVIAWELYDRLPPNEPFRFKKWKVSITVPRVVLEAFLSALVGPRP